MHSLITTQVPAPSGQEITTPVISLNTLNQQYGTVDLIRMDFEGYEQTILQSLVDLNQNQRFLPSIIFELHPTAYNQEHFRQLLTDLYQLGYHAKYLACSHLDLLKGEQLKPVTSIPTDGTVRHIAENIPLPALLNLYPRSRAALLTIKQT